MAALEKIRIFLDNRYTDLAVGIILVTAAVSEALQTLESDLEHLRLRASHGVAVFGLFHTLKALAGLFERVKKTAGAVDSQAK